MLNQVTLDQTSRRQSLYSADFEHDSCGVGFIAQVSGKRSNQVADDEPLLFIKFFHTNTLRGVGREKGES